MATNRSHSLLTSSALSTTAFLVMLGLSSPSSATLISDGQTYGPTDDTSGYEYYDGGTANATFTASEGNYFTIGQDGTPSLDNTDSGSITVEVTNGGGAIGTSGVIFADDVQQSTGTVSLDIDNGHVIFQGNIADIGTVDVGNATPTTSQVDFQIVNSESLTINADFGAVSEANTVNVDISNQSSDHGSNMNNAITFDGVLGSTYALDDITIADAGATNTNNVVFNENINASNLYIGESGGVTQTHNITFGGDGGYVNGDIVGLDGDTVNITVNKGNDHVNHSFNDDVSNIDLINVTRGRVDFEGELTNSSLQLGGSQAQIDFEGATTYDSDIALTDNAIDVVIRFSNTITYSGDITAASGSSVEIWLEDYMSSGAIALTGNITLASDQDTLSTWAGANTISGDIDFGAGADTFSVEDDTATLTGELTNLESVVIGQYSESTLVVNEGGSFTGDVTGGSNGTLAYGRDDSDSTFDLNGDVDDVAVSIDSGTLNTNSHSLGSEDGIASLSISGTLNAEDDVLVDGTTLIESEGILHIGAGVTVTTDDFSTDSGTVVFDIASPSSAGYLNVVDGVVNLEGTTLEANVTGDDSLFTNGNQIKVAAGTAALIGIDGETGQESTIVEENSALFVINAMDGSQLTSPLSANDLYYVFSQEATIEETATSSNNKSTGAVFDELSGTEDTELSQIITRLNAASQEELDEILDSTTPDVASAVAAGSQNFVNNTLDITNEKINIARYGGNGLSAGDGTRESRSWGQLFGQATRQGYREGIAGYDANTYGLALGYDVKGVVDNTMFGVAVSYGVTDVDSDNATHSSTDINSYQLTAYGSYDLPKSVFLKSMLAYAYNDVETTRYNVGGLGNNAEGSYDADIYTVRVDAGRDYRYEGVRITPSVMAHYSHYNADSYQETGAGGAGLNVDTDSLDILELGATVEAGWEFNLANGAQLSPEVRFGYRYDVIGDKVETNSYFVGGGSSFQTQGADPAQGTLSLGGGIIYELNDGWDVSADYQYEYKSEYHSNSGLLRASYKF